jgi:excisionase family DNA binding protein
MSSRSQATALPPIAYRPAGAARAVGVNRATVYRWIKLGLPARKIGNVTLILAEDLRNWVSSSAARLGD